MCPAPMHQAVREPGLAPMAAWTSIGQVLDGLLDLSAEVSVSFYKLVASSRAVYEIAPFRQRVVALATGDSILWRGKANEKARQPARKRQRRASKPKAAPLAIEDAPREVDAQPEVQSGDSFTGDEEAQAGDDESECQALFDEVSDLGSENGPSDAEDYDYELHAEEPVEDLAGDAVCDGADNPEKDETASEAGSGIGAADINAVIAEVGMPEEAVPPPMPPPPPEAPRAFANRVKGEQRVVLPNNSGTFVRYPSTHAVVLHCPRHVERNCRMTRTLRPSPLSHRAGQGRPLALMLAWSDNCPDGLDSLQHVHGFAPSLEQRQEARRKLIRLAEGIPDLKELLETHERKPREGEPVEPERVP